MLDSNSPLTPWILSQTGARAVIDSTLVQELWNGYGELLRIRLDGGRCESVILKRVVPPADVEDSISDRRKRRSYEVERAWYQHGAPLCDDSCRVALCLGVCPQRSLLLLEDLRHSGFKTSPDPTTEQVESGLAWLASFHSRFLRESPTGLWEQGSYWHFQTRKLEWGEMEPGIHKEHAALFDKALRSTKFRTVVHGDPKPPNFCWNDRQRAAAVDFQYVGSGCGIRDVALFLDRGLGRLRCRTEESVWLDRYFSLLQKALQKDEKDLDFQALQTDWRARFPVAWSDYARFALGWSKSYRPDDYTVELAKRALDFCGAL